MKKEVPKKPIITITGPLDLLEEIRDCNENHLAICECWRNRWDLIYNDGTFHGQRKLCCS